MLSADKKFQDAERMRKDLAVEQQNYLKVKRDTRSEITKLGILYYMSSLL